MILFRPGQQLKLFSVYRDIAIEQETIMQNSSPFLVMEVQENTANQPLPITSEVRAVDLTPNL